MTHVLKVFAENYLTAGFGVYLGVVALRPGVWRGASALGRVTSIAFYLCAWPAALALLKKESYAEQIQMRELFYRARSKRKKRQGRI